MTTTSNIATATSALDQYKRTETATQSDEMGQDEFLQLLVAQLNNQNPLEPQENGEFVAQLAQLSTVEGIDKLNSTVENIFTDYQSGQALQASSLVGRSVMLETDKAVVDTSGEFLGSVSLPSSSANVYVNVYNTAGTMVRQIELGQQAAGDVDFSWDGKDSAGAVAPAGTYRFEALSSNNGSTTALSTLLPARVSSVTLGQDGGEMMLNIAGVGSMALSKVQVVGQ